MKVLLIYGTTEGQTQKIARFVADHLAQAGHVTKLVHCVDATEAIDLRGFDAVIVAASIHAGHYQAAVTHFVRDHLADINARANALLSVSLAAAGEDTDDIEGLSRCVAQFIHETGWTPRQIHHVAGAFRYTSYDFLKRWALKYIAWRKGAPTDVSRDYELTDWSDLTVFIDTFVKTSAAQAAQIA
jgi:menaquinone-dependent protoporphyrinogen oxidase